MPLAKTPSSTRASARTLVLPALATRLVSASPVSSHAWSARREPKSARLVINQMVLPISLDLAASQIVLKDSRSTRKRRGVKDAVLAVSVATQMTTASVLSVKAACFYLNQSALLTAQRVTFRTTQRTSVPLLPTLIST